MIGAIEGDNMYDTWVCAFPLCQELIFSVSTSQLLYTFTNLNGYFKRRLYNRVWSTFQMLRSMGY